MNEQISRRIEWVDILRGIGILIMIMGHVGFGGKFDRIIHSYHMPLFFMISGFLFRQKSTTWKVQILHKTKTLLVPYISFFLINYLVWLYYNIGYKNPIKPIIIAFTWNNHGMPIAGALWFLTALFFTEVFYIILDQKIKDGKKRIITIFILALVSSCITSYTSIRLPLSIDQGIIGLLFYEFGRQGNRLSQNPATNFTNLSKTKTIILVLLLPAANIVLSFVNGYVNMKEGWYSIIPLTWLNAILGTLGLMYLAILIDRNCKKIKIFFTSVGKDSIVYVGLNQMIILFTSYLPIAVIGNSGNLSVILLLGSLISFVVSILVLYLLSIIFMKTPLKILCGK